MPQYYSTFPAGFEPAVEEFIARDVPGAQVLRMLEGAVEYKRRGVLKEFPRWLNNSYLCLTTFPRAPKDPIQDMVRLALQRGVDPDVIRAHLPSGAATFRAMFMLGGGLAHAGLKTMAKAEEFIAASSGLRPGPAKPDVEFWFLYRREGVGFLLMRLTRHRDYAGQFEAGELRPDVAHLLCRLSNPKPGDVFLDPFAGYGGIAKARLAYPAGEIVAGDVAPQPALQQALKGAANARAVRMDALDMRGVRSGSVDAIVCDPPWGLYAKLPEPAAFYGKFASEARRVLKKGGRLVMLTALKKEAEAALGLGFTVEGRLDVLVSGRKAAVFICRN
jgi:predicted RNA methylase